MQRLKSAFCALLIAVFLLPITANAGCACMFSRCLCLNKGANYYYMGGYTGLVVLDNGIEVFVDTRDSFITPRLIKNGRWENNQLRLIEKYIEKDSQIIEVGSNMGYYTMNMSKTLKKKQGKGHIYAFEANPDLTHLLSRSSSVNQAYNVTIFNEIVYSTAGQKMTFDFNESNIGMGRVNSTIHYPKNSKKHTFESYTTTLDQTIKQKNIDIIRIDAEGSELEILKGARNILNNNPEILLFIEWATDALQNNSNIEKEIDYYLSNGYKFFEMKKNDLIEINTKKQLLELPLSNILITKRKI